MEVEIVQMESGTVTITGASGVDILSFKDGTNGFVGARKLAGRYAVAALKKLYGSNRWLLSGNLDES